MLALYVVTASFAAALLGIYVRTFLASLGLITGLEAGLFLIAGAGSAFLVVQCVWTAFCRALNPARSPGFYFSEMGSHAAALILVPYITHTEVDWPHPMLARGEPLVYLGAFLGLHAFMKLAAFYGSLGGHTGSRLSVAGWLGAAAVFGFTTYAGLTGWVDRAAGERPEVSPEAQLHRAGPGYAMARELPEGAVFVTPVEAGALTDSVVLRWAADQNPDDPIEDAYVTVQVDGAELKIYEDSVPVDAAGWQVLRLPPTMLPADADSFSIRWTSRPQPNWQRLLGLNPVAFTPPNREGRSTAAREVWMAGPLYHQARPMAKAYNVLIFLIDGLNFDHASFNGYKRPTTPNLDNLARSGTAYFNASSPSPHADDAALSLLAGRNSRADTPALLALYSANRYATAAFSEAEGARVAEFDDPESWAQAVEIYDPGYGTESSAGSRHTAAKVRNWIEDHENETFAIFTRMRELGDLEDREWYDYRFMDKDRPKRPIDVYDAALTHLDAQIGAIVAGLTETDLQLDTIVVVAAPYRQNFSIEGGPLTSAGGQDAIAKVPVIISVPGQLSSARTNEITLADVGVTLAALANATLPDADGNNLLLRPEN